VPAGAAPGKELKSIVDKILHFLFNRLQLEKPGKGASERSDEMHTQNCRWERCLGWGNSSLTLRKKAKVTGLFLVGIRDQGHCSHDGWRKAKFLSLPKSCLEKVEEMQRGREHDG